MVEGPGCKLKGETLQKRARGQAVKGVLGNAVDRHTKKKRKAAGDDTHPVPATQLSPYHALLGRTCSEVLTLGKELFMFFEGTAVCLRVHFLMAGGIRVNGENLDKDGGGDAKTASLTLRMSKDVITFNKSSVEMRPSEESRQRVMDMRHLDICSSYFSHQRAVETLMKQEGSRIMVDLLLDQLLLPGVGNIIKNEALIDSRIKADATLSSLTGEHISFLVKMTRDFSMLFYKCRREAKPLQPYLKIYRKAKCGVCQGKAVTTRMGVDNERLTTYCPTCQDNDITKLKTGNSASKNSLLGWVTTGVVAQGPEWPCALCTYLNKNSSTACAMCTSPRPAASPSARTPTSQDTKLNTSIKNTLSTPQQNIGSTTRTQKGASTGSTTQPFPMLNSNHLPTQMTPPMPTMTPPWEGPMSKRPRLSTLNNTTVNQTASSNSKTSSVTSSPSMAATPTGSKTKTPVVPSGKKFPACSTHGAPCMLREVRKEGQNKGRMFFCCPTKNCNFFMWGDEKFPFCESHGKRCVLRTVLKQGANNGRRFFACPQPKKKQCSTFHWADQYNNLTVR